MPPHALVYLRKMSSYLVRGRVGVRIGVRVGVRVRGRCRV